MLSEKGEEERLAFRAGFSLSSSLGSIRRPSIQTSRAYVPSETGENGSASLYELAFLFLSSPVACTFNLPVGSQESLSLGYGGV